MLAVKRTDRETKFMMKSKIEECEKTAVMKKRQASRLTFSFDYKANLFPLLDLIKSRKALEKLSGGK